MNRMFLSGCFLSSYYVYPLSRRVAIGLTTFPAHSDAESGSCMPGAKPDVGY
jgi:hypothetical protein